MLTDLEDITCRLAAELADHEVAPLIHDLTRVVDAVVSAVRAYDVIVTRGAGPLLAAVVGAPAPAALPTATQDPRSA